MALKEITPIGIVCHVCDKTGKFFDKDKKELMLNPILRKCKNAYKRFVLKKVAEEHSFADKLLDEIPSDTKPEVVEAVVEQVAEEVTEPVVIQKEFVMEVEAEKTAIATKRNVVLKGEEFEITDIVLS